MTKDHIPPKSLFAKPRPNNLITVPCCLDCNQRWTMHDEYFKLMLLMRGDVSSHPEAIRLQPSIIRSVYRPEMNGLLRSIGEGITEVELHTRSGIYLGPATAYKVWLERLSAVGARIARGLFYHEKGYALPGEYAVIGVTEPFANAPNPDDLSQRMAAVLSVEPKIFGKGVFSYQAYFIKTNPNLSQWYFEFFETVSFFCITIEESHLKKADESEQKAG